jgi:hypothetical protein
VYFIDDEKKTFNCALQKTYKVQNTFYTLIYILVLWVFIIIFIKKGGKMYNTFQLFYSPRNGKNIACYI